MCLIAVAWQAHPDYPLIVLANRDEFHARPAAPARSGEPSGAGFPVPPPAWSSICDNRILKLCSPTI